MPLFEIATFQTLTRILLAARKLAGQSDLLDRAKTLADLANDANGLAAAIRGADLSPVAAEMERRAQAMDRAITHEGAALDDARAVFWQVAPHALADPDHLTGAALDPVAATDAMVHAILASPMARDFRATTFAETYFRKVMTATLGVMLENRTAIDAMSPALWRRTLENQGIQIATLDRLEAKADAQTDMHRQTQAMLLQLVEQSSEARTARASGVTEARIVALAQLVSADVTDPGDALRELESMLAEAARTHNAPALPHTEVDPVLQRLRDRLESLADKGALDAARAEAADAFDRWQAEENARQARAARTGAAILTEAIQRDLEMRDTDSAAAHIARRVDLRTPDPTARLGNLREEWRQTFLRAEAENLRLHLELAVSLARLTARRATTDTARGIALNDLGISLKALGEREPGAARLTEAVTIYQEAAAIWNRDENPEDWAQAQMNLGNALTELGTRARDTDALHKAVAMLRAALEVWTRDQAPDDWARAQMNLCIALGALGERGDAAALRGAAEAGRAVLQVWTRETAPGDWAQAQMNLGIALVDLGRHDPAGRWLDDGISAYRAALTVWTRESDPSGWAMLQMNLGNALARKGEAGSGTGPLRDALAAYGAALEISTSEAAPNDWALTRINMARLHLALADRIGGQGAAAHVTAAQSALDDARSVFAPSQDRHYLAVLDDLQGSLDRQAG